MASVQVGSPIGPWSGRAYLPDGDFVDVTSEALRGKWVVLFFWPLDFTFVCPTEIRAFAQAADEFRALGAEILGCSTDSVYAHKAWTEGTLGRVPFPMIGDTAHGLAKRFGVLLDAEGVALRGTFIINPEGVLVSATIHHLNVGRNVEETLRTLRAFQTGELTPCGWTPGTQTLGKP